MNEVARRWENAKQVGLTRVVGNRSRMTRRALSRPSRLERRRERAEVKLDALELEEVRRRRPPNPIQPRVTIRIATYSAGNRIRRALDSALAQDYPNFEVVVVGDCCDDATASVVASYSDCGVRFVNLGRRGQYPYDKRGLWLVAGCTPMNVASLIGEGEWIAPLDDDDAFTPDHVSTLISTALSRDAEMVWSDAAMQRSDGAWWRTPGPPMKLGRISHGSVLFRSDISFIQLNRRSHLVDEPADWNLWRRMERIGVRISYCPQVTYYHYA